MLIWKDLIFCPFRNYSYFLSSWKEPHLENLGHAVKILTVKLSDKESPSRPSPKSETLSYHLLLFLFQLKSYL